MWIENQSIFPNKLNKLLLKHLVIFILGIIVSIQSSQSQQIKY